MGFYLKSKMVERGVLKDLREVLFALKAIGLFPYYEYVSSYKVRCSSSKFKIFYSCLARNFVNIITILVIYDTLSTGLYYYGQNVNGTDDFNSHVDFILGCFTSIMVMRSNSNILMRIINDILKVDMNIKNRLNAQIVNNCGFLKKFIIFVCFCKLDVILMKKNTVSSVKLFILFLFNLFQSMNIAFFIMFIAGLLSIIASRLRILNMNILNHSKIGDVMVTYGLYNKLLKTYKKINKVYGLTIVSFTCYVFYAFSSIAYLTFIRDSSLEQNSMLDIQMWFVWLSLHLSLLVLLCRCSTQTTKEVIKNLYLYLFKSVGKVFIFISVA